MITVIIPAPIIDLPENTLERFRDKISHIEPESQCWRWKAHVGKWGYGQFWWSNQVGYAHVFSHLAFVGPVPDGFEVDHVLERGCAYRDCVNPAHLEAVTKRINTLRSETAVSAVAARKTHCPQGHPYSGENLYTDASGGRKCRTCVLSRQKDAYHKNKGPSNHPRDRTHCPKGHEYSGANLYTDSFGKRHCRSCKREAGRRYRARKKG